MARGPSTKELTAVELEMMNVIWRIGPCSVARVQEQLQPERDLAYTSVSTIVRIQNWRRSRTCCTRKTSAGAPRTPGKG